MSYAWFNALDALLFLILGFAGLTRIRTGFVASQGQIQRSVPFIVLSLYCFTRSAVLTVTALDKIPRNQDFEQNMFDAAPATFYALLQTALIWKWVSTVADVTLVLECMRFSVGDVVRISSLILGITQPFLSIYAFLDVRFVADHLSEDAWDLLLQLYCGLLYMYNGLAFSVLGLLLMCLWNPTSSSAVARRLKILGIAVVFGTVTFFRGLMLTLFLFRSDSKHLSSVINSSWNAPSVLFAEWWSIVISLFILPYFTAQSGEPILSVNVVHLEQPAASSTLVQTSTSRRAALLSNA